MSFLGEIKRRKIFQVAAVYAVVAWLLIQIVATIEAPLNLPDWVDTLVIVLLAIGFPITLIMSWTFNLTSDGLAREQGDAASLQSGSRKIEYMLTGLLAVAMVWLIYRVEFDVPELSEQSGALAEQAAADVSAAIPTEAIPNSIAVLPFENLSPDPDNAYFAAGIQESTLNQLAKIHDLVVISRTSVMQYEKDRPPVPEIAKALNVETIMEGSVRYANGRVLITAQLIDGKSDAHLWSDEFNRDLADVFAVQAQVAEQIAKAMQVQLLPDERARIENRPTESAEAYEHYLRALSMPGAILIPEYVPVQVDLLNRAITADPEFAEAYAQLAWVYYTLSSERHLAVEYANRAIEIDPTVGRAHFVIGMRDRYYYARQDDARAALQHAIDLSPNDPNVAVQAGRHLAEQSGQYEAAIQFAKRAVAAEPNAAFIHNQLGFLLMRAGDPTAAAEHFRESTRLDPGIFINYMNLASAQYLVGDHSAAKENLDFALQIMRSDATFRVDYLVYLYGLIGEPEQAVDMLAKQGASTEDPQSDVWETLGWAVLGTRNRDNALRVWTATIDGYLNDDQPVSLGRITRFRDNWLNDPILDEPEFAELRRRLGFRG